jgi:VIT1/CCC1 family predicted Fe2+/Mn2+ transporter
MTAEEPAERGERIKTMPDESTGLDINESGFGRQLGLAHGPKRWRMKDTLSLRRLSFGTPAGITSSMALVVGLDAATAGPTAIVGSFLIAGLADNLTDSLSVHIYQETERLAERQAFRTTIANFIARFGVSVSFVLLFLILPAPVAIPASVIWGFLLLSGLSYLLAKARHVGPLSEICKHASVAIAVIAISKAIGFAIKSVTACS